jgi:hypothetical protein
MRREAVHGVKAKERFFSPPDMPSRASSAVAKVNSKSSSRQRSARLVKAQEDVIRQEVVWFAMERVGRACNSAGKP